MWTSGVRGREATQLRKADPYTDIGEHQHTCMQLTGRVEPEGADTGTDSARRLTRQRERPPTSGKRSEERRDSERFENPRPEWKKLDPSPGLTTEPPSARTGVEARMREGHREHKAATSL